ncbi:unnamed protein product [Rotaria magnacalcarata]|uniref:Uncharacterized protein n=1 Tax=Rotaria magnacalcarata TaxID=392030 RepID=A0A816CVD5_9BILA|nr:unnamed protein product [Rotaria magnacalcarata]CAF1627387.1 unnamed protein product [Rotaria magnacalcarata]CAF2035010.1 unnamed protein product [Rotaria magnacalcarata]CAF2066402.1 unnamed protein product [Rotaria magnacalcarata]CAF2227425.1 unnamed protein product [Rotaria magnacalcarata]
MTVAGGHGKGNATDQLDCPYGFFIDTNHGVVVADSNNSHIVRWNMNNSNGQLLAGGCGKGNRWNQLDCSSDVMINKGTDDLSLFVIEYIIEYYNSPGQSIL